MPHSRPQEVRAGRRRRGCGSRSCGSRGRRVTRAPQGLTRRSCLCRRRRLDSSSTREPGRNRMLRSAAQDGQHFVRRLAAVERRDQRLDDRHGAVVGAHVAPRFEVVRLGDVPVAERRGLVLVADRGARERATFSIASANFRSDGRGVDRIGAEDEQERRRCRRSSRRPARAGSPAGRSAALRRLRVDDRRADVAERRVHRVRQRVDDGRLAIAGDDQAAAARRLQILDDAADPALRRLGQRAARRRRRRRARGHGTRERLDLASPSAAAGDRPCEPVLVGVLSTAYSRFMLRRSPSMRRRATRTRGRGGCPPRRCTSKSASSERMTSAFSTRYCGVDVFAERQRGCRRARCRGRTAPTGSTWPAGYAREELADLRRQRRRRHRFRQDPEARALLRFCAGTGSPWPARRTR